MACEGWFLLRAAQICPKLPVYLLKGDCTLVGEAGYPYSSGNSKGGCLLFYMLDLEIGPEQLLSAAEYLKSQAEAHPRTA